MYQCCRDDNNNKNNNRLVKKWTHKKQIQNKQQHILEDIYNKFKYFEREKLEKKSKN